ncbi:MAG: thioredoxin family protein [Actinomycetota bacterium]
MDVQVLGPGCKNCNALEAATADALERLGIDQPITKITDYGQIASYGVMSTPALAIDGDVKTTGRVPSVDEIAGIISAAAT